MQMKQLINQFVLKVSFESLQVERSEAARFRTVSAIGVAILDHFKKRKMEP